MDARITSDQRELQNLLGEAIGDSGTIWARESIESHAVPTDLWNRVSELGLFGLLASPDVGGLGLELSDLVPTLEKAGRLLVPSLVIDTVLASWLVRGEGSLGEEFHVNLAAGRRHVVIWGCDVLQQSLDQVNWVDGQRIEGVLDSAAWAECADLILMPAATIPGPSQVVSVTRGAISAFILQPTIAAMEPLYRVQLAGDLQNGTAVPLGIDVVELLSLFRLSRCIELVGLAAEVLDRSVAYAKERVAFGRPIGSFQAVKHSCAEMLVTLEAARSAIYYAAWALGTRSREALVALDRAEAFCASRLIEIGKKGIQIHGGIGYTWELDLHLFVRRMKQVECQLGARAAYDRLLQAAVSAH